MLITLRLLEQRWGAEAPLAPSLGPSVWMTSPPTSCAALIALISHGGGGDWIPCRTELSHTHADTHVHMFIHTQTYNDWAWQRYTHLFFRRATCLHRHFLGICDSQRSRCQTTAELKQSGCLHLCHVHTVCDLLLFLCLPLQASLNKLMETLGQSQPYFVKCIRSNAEKVQCDLCSLQSLSSLFRFWFSKHFSFPLKLALFF